jgi:hypothetical protein
LPNLVQGDPWMERHELHCSLDLVRDCNSSPGQ